MPTPAIVTGSSQGIGRAIAIALARSGFDIAVNHFDDTEGAKDTAKAVEAAGSRAVCVDADVSDPDAVARLVSTVTDSLGPVGVLVNNAAIFPWTDWEQLEVEEWDRVLSVNARGPFLMARACVPHMRQRGWGRIVSLTSSTFLTGAPDLMHYAASKGAVLGLTRSLARALGDDGITVNAVTTGKTLTEGFTRWFEDGTLDYASVAASRDDQCIKRFTQPEDVADMVDFLVSDRAAFITGQHLNVDGGRNML